METKKNVSHVKFDLWGELYFDIKYDEVVGGQGPTTYGWGPRAKAGPTADMVQPMFNPGKQSIPMKVRVYQLELSSRKIWETQQTNNYQNQIKMFSDVTSLAS